jgi:hypothetical protein
MSSIASVHRLPSCEAASGPAQKSHSNVFAFRPRRADPAIDVTREEAQAWWADVLRRRLPDVTDIVRVFQVTDQTARNWLIGFSRPHSNIMLQAAILWPDEFQAVAEQAQSTLRRAA